MIRKKISVVRKNNSKEAEYIEWASVAVLGFTSREGAKLAKHIEELERNEVFKPIRIPMVYWIDPARVVFGDVVWVVGERTSGEIELFYAFDSSGELLVTVCSDHTDRELEKLSVSKSKQICSKIVSDKFWKYKDIEDHVDELELVCKVKIKKNNFILYQKDKVSSILPVNDLIKAVREDSFYGKGRFCFLSGTIPVVTDELIFGDEYYLCLYDPVMERKLDMSYKVVKIPEY